MVILDKTVVYPTSGGQLHDIGTINNQKFNDAFKQGNYIVHILEEKPKFKEGDVVEVEVNEFWRTQLSQHHTATHIVNAAAREILGSHINQAGAKKTLKNSHLDITHYEQIPTDTLLEIENRSNEIVKEGINLNLKFMPRTEAEHQYGMAIYQGGAVPGKKVRIVEVPGVDVEACGGTHLNNTSETGEIKITKSQKIQDGIVRLTFTAGKATQELKEKNRKILGELQSILDVDSDKIVGRVNELLEKWKRVNKAIKTGKINENDLKLSSKKTFKGDNLSELYHILNVKKDQTISKVKKLLDEWKQGKKKLSERSKLYDRIKTDFRPFREDNRFKIAIEKTNYLSQKDLQGISSNIFKTSKDGMISYVSENAKGITIATFLGPEPIESNYSAKDIVMDVIYKFDPIHEKGGGDNSYSTGLIVNDKVDRDGVVKYLKRQYYYED